MNLSVVVPVYNVEAYLPACLDSLLDQDLAEGEYEIVCVDDGSADRSGEIAEEYAGRCPQVRVIHRENGGLSAARNTGIRAASGEYVYFIDSDDLLQRRCLGPLVRLAKERGLDQLLFDYESFPDGGAVSLTGRGVDPAELTVFESPLELRRWKAVPAWRTAWNYLVRREVLEAYGLSFPEGALFEDQEFNFWLDRCAGRCGYLNQKLYRYRRRKGSILDTFMSDERFPSYIRGRLELVAKHQDRLRDYRAGKRPKLRTPVSEGELERRMIDEVQGILNRLLAKGDRAFFRRTLAELEARGLYPYPLRWGRLARSGPLKKRGIDLVSFLYPVRWYLKLFEKLRTRI